METMRALSDCRLADICLLFRLQCVNSKGYSCWIRCMLESEFQVWHDFFIEQQYSLICTARILSTHTISSFYSVRKNNMYLSLRIFTFYSVKVKEQEQKGIS